MPRSERCKACGKTVPTNVILVGHRMCESHYQEYKRQVLGDIPAERPLSREEMVEELLEIVDGTA